MPSQTEQFFPAWESGSTFLGNGAGDEIRTHDSHLGKVVLYQLSYAREERPLKIHFPLIKSIENSAETRPGFNLVFLPVLYIQLRPLLQFPVQGTAANTQQFCRAGAISFSIGQGFAEQSLFVLFFIQGRHDFVFAID